MYEQIDAVMEVMINMLSRKDLPIAMAEFYRNTYNALKTAGFTIEETMAILVSMKTPGAGAN